MALAARVFAGRGNLANVIDPVRGSERPGETGIINQIVQVLHRRPIATVQEGVGAAVASFGVPHDLPAVVDAQGDTVCPVERAEIIGSPIDGLVGRRAEGVVGRGAR